MTTFSDLSQSLQILVCELFIIYSIVFLSMAAVILLRMRKGAGAALSAAVISMAAEQVFLDWYCSAYQMEEASFLAGYGGSTPVSLVLSILAVLSAAICFLGKRLRRIVPGSDLRLSVKEAVDDLPTGICSYLENGRVILVNDVMQRISLELCGHTVLDGTELAAAAARTAGHDGPDGRGPVKAMGRVYRFEEGPVQNREGMRQLLAVDVTDEYAGLLEVSEKNRQLRELSERLRAAVGEAERLSVEKEYLDAKIRVHSGLGGLLAATARFMRAAGEERASGPVRTDETGGSGRFSDRQRLAELALEWERLPSALLDREPSRKSSYEALMRAAEDVGIKIVLDGELPEKEPFRRVMLTAVGECITNTFRHAGGDELRISWDGSRAELTNNGSPPEGPVVEKGGLADLRRLAEGEGAVMTIESSPVFRLVIHW
ncbi:MAG: hypothetical protein IJK25_00985 [Firmicutes bacterium]|nr:hypothetical protein [Bacillota bacterium]